MMTTDDRLNAGTLFGLILLPLILTIMLSCSDENPLKSGDVCGTVRIECVTRSKLVAKSADLKPTTLAEISFYNSKGALMVSKALTVNSNRITGKVTVKAGSGYRAELNCYDDVNAITHTATATDINITAGKETTVTLLLTPALADAPSLSGPESSVLSDSTYILSWSEVSRAKFFTIEQDSNSSFSDPITTTVTETSVSFTNSIDTEQTFYYRIRTHNASGYSGWSNVVTVTVMPDPSTVLTMVSIPAGNFQMGSDDGASDEQPVHTVALDAFEMSSSEITQALYESVNGMNPSHFTGDGSLPVETVSWIDAAAFCNQLSDNDGFERCYNETTWECDFNKNGYRLPTEAEWEYACRAGTTSKYYSGNDEIELGDAGWYGANSESKTHPVGLKNPNDWGLYDMHGNVWELCNDWFDATFYETSPENNPTGPLTGTERVMRGGSWATQLQYNSSSNRHYFPVQESDRNEYVGFRIVRRP